MKIEEAKTIHEFYNKIKQLKEIKIRIEYGNICVENYFLFLKIDNECYKQTYIHENDLCFRSDKNNVDKKTSKLNINVELEKKIKTDIITIINEEIYKLEDKIKSFDAK
jgi:hypothetical protein